MPEPMVLATPEMLTPGDREFWTSPDDAKPTFWISETAKCFFGRSAIWLRKHVRAGYEWNGEVWQPLRTPNDDMYFRLHDIEVLAHLLAQEHVINGQRLQLTVTIVKSLAQLNGHF